VIVKYRRSFAKDLARINSHSMKVRIHKVIDEVKNASSLLDLPKVKQLRVIADTTGFGSVTTD
jgi:hypothetical protein